jgi:hypothetical protein
LKFKPAPSLSFFFQSTTKKNVDSRPRAREAGLFFSRSGFNSDRFPVVSSRALGFESLPPPQILLKKNGFFLSNLICSVLNRSLRIVLRPGG